jgi:hypothetical protein
VKFDLRPLENILHPNPYVAEEKPQLVVTTFRVMYSGSGKKQEMESGKLTYSGKRNDPKIIQLMVILALFALPFVIVGGLKFLHYKDLPTSAPEPVKGQPVKPLSQKQIQEFEDNKFNKWLGIGLLGFGALFAGSVYLLYKRRLIVVIGGGGKAMRIRVKDAAEQDKVLMMIGASKQSAQAMAGVLAATSGMKPPAPAAPPKR